MTICQVLFNSFIPSSDFLLIFFLVGCSGGRGRSEQGREGAEEVGGEGKGGERERKRGGGRWAVGEKREEGEASLCGHSVGSGGVRRRLTTRRTPTQRVPRE